MALNPLSVGDAVQTPGISAEIYNPDQLIAGNQNGKTHIGAFEVACHMTGLYPEWWQGRRFDKPTRGWIAGETSLVVREN